MDRQEDCRENEFKAGFKIDDYKIYNHIRSRDLEKLVCKGVVAAPLKINKKSMKFLLVRLNVVGLFGAFLSFVPLSSSRLCAVDPLTLWIVSKRYFVRSKIVESKIRD